MEYKTVSELLDAFDSKEELPITKDNLRGLLDSMGQEVLLSVKRMSFVRENYAYAAEAYRKLAKLCKSKGVDASEIHPYVREVQVDLTINVQQGSQQLFGFDPWYR